MGKKLQFVIIILVLAVVFALGGAVGLQYADLATTKRAIIILPGLFASGLYDSETGNAVWDPFVDLEELAFSDVMLPTGGLNLDQILPLIFQPTVLAELDKLMANNNMGAPDSLFNMMTMNEDATPVVKSVVSVPWESESRLRYGVINAQKDMYIALEEKYGDSYDVQVFNYDFRLDNRASAKLLADYIDARKYEEVILVSHSNGGEVAAIYLADAAHRAKVTKYISYDSPYYGSFSAITILENVAGMLDGLVSALSNISMLSRLAENVQEIFTNQFLGLLNMWAPYQLLPSYELFASGEAAYYVDDQLLEFESEDDLFAFYLSRPWAKISDGSIRVPLAQWKQFRDAMYATLPDGSKVFSTTLVNTTYFNGDGKESPCAVYYKTGTDGKLILDYVEKTSESDGTVLEASAVPKGVSPDDVVLVSGMDHYGIVTAYDLFVKDATIAAIDEYMATAPASNWKRLFKM